MLKHIPLSRIRKGNNPRTYFDPQEMTELEDAVRAYGVFQPILVRPIPDTEEFEIIAGERRWRAAKAVFGDDYPMPVNIKTVDDGDAEAMALIENIRRSNMSVAEEAQGAKRMLYRNRNDKAETARQLNWSVDMLNSRLALTACTDTVLKHLTERKIQIGHAELLAGLPPATQESVLAGILEHKVTVATLKGQLAKFARKLSSAIFDTTVCSGCQHNSAAQSGLFGESLGDGYCQHPTHFDELTMQAVESKAESLKEEYQTVTIVKLSDAFEPLHLMADGPLGVGPDQYASCKGCQHFGCAVSAISSSAGEVTPSLCFDGDCHTTKVAARHKAELAVQALPSSDMTEKKQTRTAAAAEGGSKPANTNPQRVIQYRVEKWRKWVANALMRQTDRNHRVLIALTLAGRGGDLSPKQYGDAVQQLCKSTEIEGTGVKGKLEAVDAFPVDRIDQLLLAVTASAAFGIDQMTLEALLNYLQIDERKCFRLSKEFLDLFTKSELESIAEELKLKDALGPRFKKLRDGKREDMITALLNIKEVNYSGLVPNVMRYPRKAFNYAVANDSSSAQEQVPSGNEQSQDIPLAA